MGKHLENQAIEDCISTIKKTEEKLTDAVYAQYKTVYKLADSNNFRGGYADSCKNYLSSVTENIIMGLLNVSKEINDAMDAIQKNFLAYEQDADGIVETDTLNSTASDLDDGYKKNLVSLAQEAQGTLARASQYISVKSLEEDAVYGAYDRTIQKIETFCENLKSIDSTAAALLDPVFDHMQQIMRMIDSINVIVDNKYHIDFTKVSTVIGGSRFISEDPAGLNIKLKEDPFSYHTRSGSSKEWQAAKGLNQDTLAYGGASLLSYKTAYGTEDGKHYAEGEASAFQAKGEAEFGGIAKVKGDARVGYVSGKASAGFNKDYQGFAVEGEGEAVQVSAKGTLGTDDFNGFVEGKAELGSVSGYVKAEHEKNGDFALGIGGKASAADASVKGGLSFFDYDESHYDENGKEIKSEKKSLLNFSASVHAGAKANAGVLLEQKKVIDTDSIDVHTIHVSVSAQALLGLDLDITLPFITF